MIVNQKEIVLLPFPFSDLKGNKVRPAIVVSCDFLNEHSDDCIMVPLTSVIKDKPYSVSICQDNLASGNLIAPSKARADKIFAVETGLVRMKIGTLNEETFNKIRAEIIKLIS